MTEGGGDAVSGADDGPTGDSLFPALVETDRLRLERVEPGSPSAFELYEHWREGAPNVEETTEYVAWDPYSHPRGVKETLDRAVDRIEADENAMYVVRPREGEAGAGDLAGTTSVHVEWDRRQAIFGIWLRKPFWGRGYSGERADAMVRVAFEHLDLTCVAVGHLVSNENSRRAIEKYVERNGGRCDGVFRNFVTDQDGGVHDVRNYSITRQEWVEATGGDGRGTVTLR